MPASRQSNPYTCPIPCHSRYGWASKTSYGTIEIRIHGGTISPHKLTGWLSVCADLGDLLRSAEEFPTVLLVDGKPTDESLRRIFKRPEGYNYLKAREAGNGSLVSYSVTSGGVREEVA